MALCLADELKKLICDLIYPIGSIYISVGTTDPSSLFSGKWTRIQDGFLFCSFDTNPTYGRQGNLQGWARSVDSGILTSNDTSLNINQVPEHFHDLRYGSSGGYGVTISKTGTGQYSLNVNSWEWSYNDDNGLGSGSNLITSSVGGGQGHNHTIPSHYHTIPYTEVIVWKRTA